MKRYLSLWICFTISLVVSAQTVKVKAVVDERTELLSTVFRLVGAEEYKNNVLVKYTQELDSFLTDFKQDTLIKYAKQIRKSNGISYDAVMSYAVNIQISDSIRFISQYQPGKIDSRWNPEMEQHFLTLLNDFYFKTNFHQFYTAHSGYYAEVENRFLDVLKDVDYEWFPKFFGVKSDGSFSVIISLLNRGNYGPSILLPDGSKQVYSINGIYRTDSLGFPIFGKGLEPIIIHEFTHSFTNYLVNLNIDQLIKKGKKFFKPVQVIMRQQAYGTPQTMLYEIMVRSCVIQYYKDHDSSVVEKYLIDELANGFLWIRELHELLNQYDNSRAQYPTLESFMPEIVKLQKSLSPRKLKKEYNEQCGSFVGLSIPDGSKNVPYDTVKITITFAQPMNIGTYGISYGKKGESAFPKFLQPMTWDPETKTKLTATMVLEPDKEYSLCFPGQFFLTKSGFPVEGILYLDFKTIKK